MAIASAVKSLLNNFAKSQPALTQKDVSPAADQSLALGDVLDGLTSAIVDKAVYTYAGTASGAIGAHGLGLKLPIGAIVTRVWTDELVNVTSGGSATVEVLAGNQSLVAAQAYTALAGAQAQTLSAPVKLTAEREITVTVAVAALTGGSVRIFVEYLKA